MRRPCPTGGFCDKKKMFGRGLNTAICSLSMNIYCNVFLQTLWDMTTAIPEIFVRCYQYPYLKKCWYVPEQSGPFLL